VDDGDPVNVEMQESEIDEAEIITDALFSGGWNNVRSE
jgi:hypothetical protein